MKRLLRSLLILALLTTVCCAQKEPAKPKAKPKQDDSPLKTLKERASYAIGLNIGKSIKQDDIDIDIELLAKGLADAVRGEKPLLTDAQIQETMIAFQRQVRENQLKKAKALADENKKKGEAFLAANKKKKGVITLKSGLQYQVIMTGNGATPKKTDVIKAHYHGTLIDGTVFDSSVERKEPLEFSVTGVIKGWTEALLKMKVGDKWRVVLPPELAYGERGSGPKIGPGTVLVFEMELLEINGRDEEKGKGKDKEKGKEKK